MKRTRQGVRDLNDLPAKPKGKVLEEPPVPVLCKRHVFVEDASGWFLTCEKCQYSIDKYQ